MRSERKTFFLALGSWGLALLLGCSATNLAGVWTGEVECEVPPPSDEDADFTFTMSLTEISETIYTGTLDMEAEYDGDYDNSGDTGMPDEGEHKIEVAYDIEVTLLTADGAQSFEVAAECDDFVWEFEGDELWDGCEYWDDTDFESTWDGADAVSIDDPCSGTLVRQAAG